MANFASHIAQNMSVLPLDVLYEVCTHAWPLATYCGRRICKALNTRLQENEKKIMYKFYDRRDQMWPNGAREGLFDYDNYTFEWHRGGIYGYYQVCKSKTRHALYAIEPVQIKLEAIQLDRNAWIKFGKAHVDLYTNQDQPNNDWFTCMIYPESGNPCGLYIKYNPIDDTYKMQYSTIASAQKRFHHYFYDPIYHRAFLRAYARFTEKK